MAWRTIVISSPARLKILNNQLVIEQKEAVSLPLEDIQVILLESPEVLLSSALLYRLAENDIILLSCDAKHLPTSVALPYANNCRVTAIQNAQIECSLPFKKRCWQAIVKQKILNQAKCLEILNTPSYKKLAQIANDVGSGDSENLESVAARIYFGEVFGPDFGRREKDWINGAINYGYAIMRASVARSLSFYGLLLPHGIHHKNTLNQFNLADDFMEPLRPIIDLYVANNINNEDELLSKEDRENLTALLYADTLIDYKRQSASRASEIMASSFATACKANEPKLLRLPDLLPLSIHSYE